MIDQDVFDALEKVTDATSFIEFLERLRADWQNAVLAENGNPSSPFGSMHGWENTNIGSFLEAAIAGGTDNKTGLEDGFKNAETAWRRAAEIILLGKIYE